MVYAKKLRNGFLAAISLGIALVTVYAIADPQAGNRRVADFKFSDEIPLTDWQLLSSESLAIATELDDDNRESIEAAQRYLYQKNQLNLILEIRYLVGTRGDISALLTKYLAFSPAAIATQKVKKIPEVGSYLLLQKPNNKNIRNNQNNQNNHLSSCLTSFGHSIADQQEFSLILNQVKLTPRLLWDWVWGKDSLRDRRCLWVHLALSAPDKELNNHKDLEQAWLELNQWLKPRFPKL